MSSSDEILRLLDACTPEERREVLEQLRRDVGIHPFETSLNASAEIILEALARAPALTIIGIRGIIGEATFALEVVPTLKEWKDVTPRGNHAYDSSLQDAHGIVRVQVKMQRRTLGEPLIKRGLAVVEVQRTRGGEKNGQDTRPYRFTEFDILAVCLEPSLKKWNAFIYIPARWLIPRPKEPDQIAIMQAVSLSPDDLWTDDFSIAVCRLRSGDDRPDKR